MNWIIGVIIIVCIAGIAFFGGNTPSKKKTREQLLRDLEKLLEGKSEEMEGYTNSYRINFNFEGNNFYYDDLETMGFKDKVYKSYLKIDSISNLTLTFGEKRRSNILEHQYTAQHKEGIVRVPKDLNDFSCYSNNPPLAEDLLKDPKVVKIFKSFRNIDPRGKPFLCLKINKGTIILEFPADGDYNPKPLRYIGDQAVIEEYLDKLALVKDRLEAL